MSLYAVTVVDRSTVCEGITTTFTEIPDGPNHEEAVRVEFLNECTSLVVGDESEYDSEEEYLDELAEFDIDNDSLVNLDGLWMDHTNWMVRMTKVEVPA